MAGFTPRKPRWMPKRFLSDSPKPQTKTADGKSSFRPIAAASLPSLRKPSTLPPAADSDPTLSEIEQKWSREISGRAEVVHPPGLAETAKLTAASVDEIITAHSALNEKTQVPQLNDDAYRILKAHGTWLSLLPDSGNPEKPSW